MICFSKTRETIFASIMSLPMLAIGTANAQTCDMTFDVHSIAAGGGARTVAIGDDGGYWRS